MITFVKWLARFCSYLPKVIKIQPLPYFIYGNTLYVKEFSSTDKYLKLLNR